MPGERMKLSTMTPNGIVGDRHKLTYSLRRLRCEQD